VLSEKEIRNIIYQSNGTTDYHKISHSAAFPIITDGVLAVAEAAECYWLLDVIGSYQTNPKLDKNFQVWKLKVNKAESSAVVRGYNDTTLIITQEIHYTNFPLGEISFYLIGGVLLLPSEY